jgi:hypothetical protein
MTAPVIETYAPAEGMATKPPKPTRTFRVVPEHWRPVGAVPPASDRSRGHALRAWRERLFAELGGSGRTMRVAWLVCDLSGRDGHCFASDASIGRAASMTRQAVNAALADLEAAGMIARAHVLRGGGQAERRIWLLGGVTENETGGVTENGAKPVTENGTQRYKGERGGKAGRFETPTMRQARMAAEARERAEERRQANELPRDAGGLDARRAGGCRE